MKDRRLAWVTLLFAVLTAVATWPQVLHPASVPPNQDSWLSLWRIAWIAHQLPRDPERLFAGNIYYPARGTLAFSDATLLQGALVSPLIWLGLPVPYAMTLLVLGSFVFAGVAAWLLVRELTGSSRAGLLAGLVFAFAPYRFDHYVHLELLWTGWMPLVLLAVHRAVDRGSWRAGVAFGLLFAAQGLSCIYYSVLFGTVLVAFCAVLVVGLSGAAVRRAVLSLGCGGLIAGALLAPYMTPYRQARTVVGERSIEEARVYSAKPADYLAATPDNRVYGALNAGPHEKQLFPGMLAILLALVALWPPISRQRIAYLVALVLVVDLSFGPAGVSYDWLREYVVPYRGLRALARAGGVALLMVAVLAGFGWARLERTEWLARRLPMPLVFVALFVMMAAEYATTPRTLVAATITPAPVYEWLAAQADRRAVIELPMPDVDGPPLHEPEFMYQSTFHWHPIVNGYSGHAPALYMDVRRAMRTFPSDEALERLKDLRVRYIVLHEHLLGAARYKAATDVLDVRVDLTRHGPFAGTSGESVVYVIAPEAR